MEELIAVAFLRRARGIKGELIGHSLTSHPERFQKLNRVLLRKGAEIREAAVESVWLFRGDPVFKLAGVDSMTAAELLAGYDVCVPAPERAELDAGEYFFDDIVGCAAVAFASGESCGKVVGWQENGPRQQVWFEVEDRGKTFLVPYHREIFREIDVVLKRVRLDLPEGLRDLN